MQNGLAAKLECHHVCSVSYEPKPNESRSFEKLARSNPRSAHITVCSLAGSSARSGWKLQKGELQIQFAHRAVCRMGTRGGLNYRRMNYSLQITEWASRGGGGKIKKARRLQFTVVFNMQELSPHAFVHACHITRSRVLDARRMSILRFVIFQI